MKKRNTTIFAFLLLAAVGMGVGYAAISQEFEVGGDITVNTTAAEEELEKDVYFSGKTEDKCTVTINDEHSASIDVNGLEVINDVATATLTIQNNYELDVIVKGVNFTEGSKSEFTVTCGLVEGTKIEAGDSLTFTFTVKLNVMPTQQLIDSFGLSFNVEADYTAA